MKARLVLEDGKIYCGESFGYQGEKGGEVVFNTGMTGYQEIISDPSYCGQIVVLTYPLIGNYGINPFDFQSKNSLIHGLIVREHCDYPNHWQADFNISEYLKEQKIIGLSGIDTRALTKHLRKQGTMRGIISTLEEESDQSLIEKAQNVPNLSDFDYVKTATTKRSYEFEGSGPHVALLDLGCKYSIIHSLQEKGCRITVLPATTSAEDILSLKPDGLLLSNGPGDPKKVPYVVDTVKELLHKLPVFGICLGHQVLGLALGGDTYKLKFGHRGTNHPVKDVSSEKIFITSQNHGYALIKESIDNLPVSISHINLNDHTVEGMRHNQLPLFSVQFHPEGSPGPYDSIELFEEFINLIQNSQKVS